jgi:hypothetical protein
VEQKVLGQMDRCALCKYQIHLTKQNGEPFDDCDYANYHWDCIFNEDYFSESDAIKQTILENWFK